jgi:hypothetical protein
MAACDAVDAAKAFDYEAAAELFSAQIENSIVNSPDTGDLTAQQTQSDLQSRNCRNRCCAEPTSKSMSSGSTAMQCVACTTAPNFRLIGVLQRNCSGNSYTTQDRRLQTAFPAEGR